MLALILAFSGTVHVQAYELLRGELPTWLRPWQVHAMREFYAVGTAGFRRAATLIYYDGYLVYENYGRRFDETSVLPVFSLTKSILATLTGVAMHHGYITCLQQPVYRFFPEVRLTEEHCKRNMTIEHLLQMRSGLAPHDLRMFVLTNDTARAAFALPQRHRPGEVYAYCNTVSPQVLTGVLERATGMRLYDFAQHYLFDPMGLTSISWCTLRCGQPNGGFGMHISAPDMLQWGRLKLYDGMWQGTRLLPEGWTEFVRPDDRAHPFAIGRLWWGSMPSRSRGHAFAARGALGQSLTIYPETNIIVVRMGTLI